MIRISLADFVDFVAKSGRPKRTKVKEAKFREDYQPKFDFWKFLRDQIIDYHRSNKSEKEYLDEVLPGLTNKLKLKNYPSRIEGYKKFLGRKKTKYFEAPKRTVTLEGVNIIVNPDLGLFINNEPHVIKLYFKNEPLSKQKLELIHLLLDFALKDSLMWTQKVGQKIGVV